MNVYHIQKGKDLSLKGAAEKKIVDVPLPAIVAIQPGDFKGIKHKPVVKVDSAVKVGSALIIDKNHPDIKIVSPASGRVKSVNRGDKRVLLEIVIETDGRQETETFQKYSEGEIETLMPETVTKHLMNGGLWPVLRERPFSRIANSHHKPKAVFVHAMNTEPLALDIDFILQGKEREFQAGLNILRKLTSGEVHVCAKAGAQSKILTAANNVQLHQFAGPHPAGNVSTHIHYIDPLNKGETVWYVEAQDVLRIAALFLNGKFDPTQIVAVTGEGAKNRAYFKTVIGTPLAALLQGSNLEKMRCLSGSVLAGKNVGSKGYVGFYDSQVTVIPEGGKRELLGWIMPGFNKYSFSKTFASSFLPSREFSVDTDKRGSDRAIVLNNVYDEYVPLDIMTYFLLKAVIAGDIEEAEKLGILECDEEDFALCSFACPSKTDVGGIIRSGLELIEKEG